MTLKIKLVLMPFACKPSIQEAETTKLEVEGHPWLHIKLKASFSPQRPSLKCKGWATQSGLLYCSRCLHSPGRGLFSCSPGPAQQCNILQWLSDFPFFFWVWLRIPTSTSQQANQGQSSKCYRLPRSQCAYVSYRALKTRWGSKSHHQFSNVIRISESHSYHTAE